MLRNYIPDPRGIAYVKRSKDKFEQAIAAVKREGAALDKLPRISPFPTQFYLDIKEKDLLPQGGQTALCADKEALIVDRLVICIDWGYPFDFLTLRLFVKGHLDQKGLDRGDCLPFIVEGHQVGLIRPEVMVKLQSYPDVFHIHADAVELNPAFRDYSERTAKVDAVLKECRLQNVFVALKGWRDECYEVRPMFSNKSLLKMDRSATCLFGIRNYGVDINGYVMDPVKGMCIWLQRRSATKQTWPGKWDNMVGGGLSVGYGILETAIKEAEEEASIPIELMRNLRPAGCVSFTREFLEQERTHKDMSSLLSRS